RWTYQGAHGAAYCPAVGNVSGDAADEIVVGSYSAKIHVFSHDGKLEATLPLPAATNATPPGAEEDRPGALSESRTAV
ncbi:MAG: hypothetical protein ACC645_20765, partial [Pirellulales bacterium]